MEFFLPRAVSSRALAVRFVCGQLLVVVLFLLLGSSAVVGYFRIVSTL